MTPTSHFKLEATPHDHSSTAALLAVFDSGQTAAFTNSGGTEYRLPSNETRAPQLTFFEASTVVRGLKSPSSGGTDFE
jgi:hypothetical protein